MSLRKNIAANYVGQCYITLIGIAMLPVYLRYMGAEALGLVGFFVMLQVWFNILDLGLTPTVVRETARFRGGVGDPVSYRSLVRTLEGVFLIVALTGGGVLFAASEYISERWLRAVELSSGETLSALQLMALIVATRWMCGLYRGAISGSERLVWLNWYNSLIATLRFVGVIPVLVIAGATPTVFFGYQFWVALLELSGLLLYAYKLMPALPESSRLQWAWSPLKPVLKFSLTIAFTSSIWILVTQTDKLVLSTILPLAEYGFFTIAVLVSSGVLVISGPVGSAIMPRLVRMEAEGDRAGVILVYRQATQTVAVIVGTVAITMAFCAEALLWAWTGDKVLAGQAAPVLTLYAIGNGIVAISAFPYYLQYAKGDLRLHLIGNIAFVMALVPTIIWAASEYGAIGAGFVWLTLNAITFVGWLPLVPRKFAPRLNMTWYSQDVLLIVLVSATVGYILHALVPFDGTRGAQALDVLCFATVVLISGACASTMAIKRTIGYLKGS